MHAVMEALPGFYCVQVVPCLKLAEVVDRCGSSTVPGNVTDNFNLNGRLHICCAHVVGGGRVGKRQENKDQQNRNVQHGLGQVPPFHRTMSWLYAMSSSYVFLANKLHIS